MSRTRCRACRDPHQSIGCLRNRRNRIISRQLAVGSGQPLECGGKRSATPLWMFSDVEQQAHPKRRRRFALPAHSKDRVLQWTTDNCPLTSKKGANEKSTYGLVSRARCTDLLRNRCAHPGAVLGFTLHSHRGDDPDARWSASPHAGIHAEWRCREANCVQDGRRGWSRTSASCIVALMCSRG